MYELVSIIIPAYNAGNTLERCIYSCVEQTYSNIEIIIVNDGSIDNTRNVCNCFTEKFTNIFVINKENEGLVVSRRVGLKSAKGKYIFFVDADDFLEKNAIEKAINCGKEYDIVIANFAIENEHGKNLGRTNNFAKYSLGSSEGLLANMLTKSITPSLCGRLIRKDIIMNVNVPNAFTIGEDCIANLMIIRNNKKLNVKLLDDCLYHYIQYPVSMINNSDIATLQARLRFIEWVIVFFRDNQLHTTFLNTSLQQFVLTEFFSFLRDGGTSHIAGNLDLTIRSYINIKTLIKLPIWRQIILLSYKYCAPLSSILAMLLSKLRCYLRR